jgi:hypothetical protein
MVDEDLESRGASRALAEALEAVEAGLACWTWQLWGQPLMRHERGSWALRTLSQFFGPDYLQRRDGRPPAGLFDQAIAPQLGPARVDRVIELASRLAAVRAQPGFDSLASEAAANAQPSYFAHLQALLAVAAPLATDGWTLDLYPANGPQGDKGRRQKPTPDLRVSRGNVIFAIEVKRLGEDDLLCETQRFTDRVTLRKLDLEQQIGHGVDVTCAEVCDDEELDRWATEVRMAAGRGDRTIAGPGAGQTQIHAEPGGMGSLIGPRIATDLWGRIASAIHRAGRQLRDTPRGWVIVQDDGSLAWATPWSRKPLGDKLSELTGRVRVELSRHSLAGAVITTGRRNEAGPVPEEDVPGTGCLALRRQLAGSQSRETFVISASALAGPGRGLAARLPAPEAQALYMAYARERTRPSVPASG